MAFSSLVGQDDGGDLAEINMIPLIDVMLVLLIIFIVTAPLLTHTVHVDLPKASSMPTPVQSKPVDLAIDGQGRLHWNGERIAFAALGERMRAAARQQPVPEVYLRAERSTPYEKVAEVMSAAARHGLTRIGFVTDPVPAR